MQLDVIFFNITKSLTIYFIHTINAATVDFAVSEHLPLACHKMGSLALTAVHLLHYLGL